MFHIVQYSSYEAYFMAKLRENWIFAIWSPIISSADFSREFISDIINAKPSSAWSIFSILSPAMWFSFKKFSGNLCWKGTTKNNFLGLSYSSILNFLHIMIIGNPFLTINKAKWGYPRFFIFIQSRDTEVGFTLRLHSLHQNPFPTISLGCFPPLRIPWSLDFNKNLKCPFCSYNKAKWKKNKPNILGRVWY